MSKKLGFLVLLMAGVWLASACEPTGDPFKLAGDFAVGNNGGCAIEVESSEIECWGLLKTDGAPAAIYGPYATPVDPGVKYEAVTVGSGHVCAVKDQKDGGVRCWGWNARGQLGDGTSTDSATPVDVIGLPAKPIVHLSAGNSSTCATFNTGAVYCWGSNALGELGDGGITDTADKVPALPGPVLSADLSPLTGVAQAAVGAGHVCALKIDRTVHCWGSNGGGTLGVGPLPGGLNKSPVALPLSLTNIASIASGPVGACAKADAGPLYCWGSPLGLSNPAFAPTDIPTVYAGFSQTPVEVSIGFNRLCALFNAGVVECLGRYQRGVLGDGSSGTGAASVPVTVIGSETHGFSGISSGTNTSCARTNDISPLIRCWGAGDRGQIGNGAILDSPTPEVVIRP